ncbi:hypothetical protein HMPREF0494_1933 [Limosilactobacillus antri DSM 16041]|uniref:Uncharacterized protein n=1 Tax=Limosilactobacillus antri DSM 16041 TaxID=525309 RepID=C8P9D9_9LACO|nr:hypothetical protein HMPREF0494_1933 [Limosilactobacillus antri DSM 16041]
MNKLHHFHPTRLPKFEQQRKSPHRSSKAERWRPSSTRGREPFSSPLASKSC